MKMFRTSATDHLSFQLGRRTFTRVVQPGESVWFPFASNEVQLLRVVQPTEAGTLRATVKVNFGVPEPGRAVLPHCYSYAPPRVSVEIYRVSGRSLTQKDYLELYLLRERFGVEPPERCSKTCSPLHERSTRRRSLDWASVPE